MKLRVASYSVMVYAPHFVAEARGLFARHGAEVELVVVPGFVGIQDQVSSGAVDVMLGNPSYAFRYAGTPRHLTPFAQINDHCYLDLVARAPKAGFRWSDLTGRVLLSSGDLTSFCAVRAALRNAGVDFAGVRWLPGMRATDVVDQLETGVGDYAAVPGEMAVRLGYPRVGTLSEQLGTMPWSVYMASRAASAAQPENLAAFRAAIGEAKAWVMTHGGAEAAPLMRRHFPASSERDLALAVDAYRAMGMWGRGPEVDRPAMARWHDEMLSFGALGRAVDLAAL